MQLITWGDGTPITHAINAGNLFWLPADTPFGNMQLKLMKIVQRLGHANLRLSESHRDWSRFVNCSTPEPDNPGTLHYHEAEEAVFLIRRAADELVALLWFLERRVESGEYPGQIKVDMIGETLRSSYPVYEAHRPLLTALNDIANAHKHSFVQTDLSIVGRDTPTVWALAHDRNRLSTEAEFAGSSQMRVWDRVARRSRDRRRGLPRMEVLTLPIWKTSTWLTLPLWPSSATLI